MTTHADIQGWYDEWFGARRDAHTQNALAALHSLLGTDTPRLEDKLTGGSMKKIYPDFDPQTGNILIKENE